MLKWFNWNSPSRSWGHLLATSEKRAWALRAVARSPDRSLEFYAA